MKLTRNKLRHLIKEELSRLTEGPKGRDRRFVGASPGDQPERGFPARELTEDESKIDITDPKQVQGLYPHLEKEHVVQELLALGQPTESPLWDLMTDPQLRLYLYQLGGPKRVEDY